jgi:CheY-like chemotaxis protein
MAATGRSALVINDRPEVAAKWAAALRKAVPRIEISEIKARHLSDEEDLEAILSKNYDYILLPSSLPNLNSLRLVELAYNHPTYIRLILITTLHDNEAGTLSRLFDAYVQFDTLNAANLQAAIKQMAEKERPSGTELYLLLEKAMAFDYFKSQGPGNSTYHDTRASMRRDGMTREQTIPAVRAEPSALKLQHNLLTLLIVGTFLVGTILAIAGLFAVGGNTELSLFGQKINSTSAGVAGIFIGAVLIIFTIRRLIKTVESMMG